MGAYPLGVNDNMPEGKKIMGSPGYGGPIVTADGSLFIGATRDRRFRAFDSSTGKELWSVRFDHNVTAVPITYLGRNGKQYVAVTAAANGQGNNESLHVFALPAFDDAQAALSAVEGRRHAEQGSTPRIPASSPVKLAPRHDRPRTAPVRSAVNWY
jgi:hypothetical protein